MLEKDFILNIKMKRFCHQQWQNYPDICNLPFLKEKFNIINRNGGNNEDN